MTIIRGHDGDHIRAGPLERLGGIGENGAGFFPAAFCLQAGDLREIKRVEDDLCGMRAAETVRDELVDPLVIQFRALPAHAADEADGAHGHVPGVTRRLALAGRRVQVRPGFRPA